MVQATVLSVSPRGARHATHSMTPRATAGIASGWHHFGPWPLQMLAFVSDGVISNRRTASSTNIYCTRLGQSFEFLTERTPCPQLTQ
eukprot:4257609-Lingulodinium_polyedra.AAC.1